MSYLQRFLHDPLPSGATPVYDCKGPAVWIGADRQIVVANYDGEALPLIDLTPDELSRFAEEMFTRWGDETLEPEFSTRHPEFEGKHNLFIYKSRIKSILKEGIYDPKNPCPTP